MACSAPSCYAPASKWPGSPTPEPDLETNAALKWLCGRMMLRTTLEGERFFGWRDGVRYATPLFLVLLVEFFAAIFTGDSIPLGISLAVVAIFIGSSIWFSIGRERFDSFAQVRASRQSERGWQIARRTGGTQIRFA